jgi:hypothetical protein
MFRFVASSERLVCASLTECRGYYSQASFYCIVGGQTITTVALGFAAACLPPRTQAILLVYSTINSPYQTTGNACVLHEAAVLRHACCTGTRHHSLWPCSCLCSFSRFLAACARLHSPLLARLITATARNCVAACPIHVRHFYVAYGLPVRGCAVVVP